MALVCLCNRVSERKVVKAIEQGADTIERVGAACDAGTCCEGCHPTIGDLLVEHSTVAVGEPVATPRFALP